jgi:hypothetical protein
MTTNAQPRRSVRASMLPLPGHRGVAARRDSAFERSQASSGRAAPLQIPPKEDGSHRAVAARRVRAHERPPRRQARRARGPAQALVELAMVLPVLLMLGFGAVGVGHLVRLHMAVDAVAREAARAATLAPLPLNPPDPTADSTARDLGERAGRDAAAAYGLAGTRIVQVDAHDFQQGSWVVADVRFTPDAHDLPYLHWAGVTFHAVHREQVDRYRSRSLP